MTVKKKSEIMPAVILISIVLFGCSKNPEPDVARTNKTSQSPTVSNNSTNQAPAVSNNTTNQAPAVSNNKNNVPVNSPNTAPQAVNNDKKPALPVKEPTPQIGSGAMDFSLFAEVRSALSSDQELLDAVIVEIKAGNVALSGNVSSEAQKIKAAQLVQSVKGIKSVKNNLRVSP
ncbi:MAG: BON domain-containing protein [Acidobacteriota bacterium]|nr:BON domain-containing protein [Acidobacteriota bacterium]